MAVLVFLVGILFGLIFVISPSEEIKIFPPPEGSTFVVAPGTARVEISWTFNDTEWLNIIQPIFRQWLFVTTTELLAQIYDEKNVTEYNTSLPEFEIVKPATLVLKNVDDRYNGTYVLCAVVWDGVRRIVDIGRSYVSVFVEAKPDVAINCSSSTTVNEGDDAICLCKGKGGNPPANVTWYKDGVQIGVAGYEKKILTLTNINKTASGTYKCVAQSYTLKDEKSIEIFVHNTLPPTVTSFTSTPEKAIIGQSVVIICEAIAVPAPSYTIIRNNTEVVSNKTIYFINVVKYSDTGSYKCTAKNKLGQSSKNYHLSAAEKNASKKSSVGPEWLLIVESLLLGIFIGIIFSCIFVHSRRQSRNLKKPHSSYYQDLDAGKMNSNGHYQSLRNESDASSGDYVNQNASTYTPLIKERDVDNNYQSLI